MKIELIADRENPPDLEYLLGLIRISDGVSAIEVDNTYLDSWLLALIQGFRSLRAGGEARVDLPEEPIPLLFALADNGVRLSYGGKSVGASDVSEFAAALSIAAEGFLAYLRTWIPDHGNEILEVVREFAAKGE